MKKIRGYPTIIAILFFTFGIQTAFATSTPETITLSEYTAPTCAEITITSGFLDYNIDVWGFYESDLTPNETNNYVLDSGPVGIGDSICAGAQNIDPDYGYYRAIYGNSTEWNTCAGYVDLQTVGDPDNETFDYLYDILDFCGVDIYYVAFTIGDVPTGSYLTMPSASTTAGNMTASLGTLFADLWPLFAILMGIPLAFYIIQRVINFFKMEKGRSKI